jgi:AcrR family transcriptional regulator
LKQKLPKNLDEKRPRGRPQKFVNDDALHQAIEVFWAHGYEGTSLTNLTDALNMNRPSIYAAFGNKQTLFSLSLQTYIDEQLVFVDEAVKQETLSEVIEMLFSKQIDLLTKKKRGCMLVQAALSCGEETQAIKDELTEQRKLLEGKLRKRFQRAQLKKDTSSSESPAAAAKYITTIYQGLSVQAASGATKKELTEVAELAKKALN